MRVIISIGLLVAFLFCYELHAQTKVLFVGNSYTYYHDMPIMVQKIAQANQKEVEVTMSVDGGVSLKDHWNEHRGLQTKSLIRQNEFDFVVIQDQSMTPIREPRNTILYGKNLSRLIVDQNGEMLVFQTWSRKNNPDSQQALDDTFSQLEKITKSKIVPVANAWKLAKAEYPNLELYEYDGSHPSEVGSYLTALVFYLFIFEQDLSTFKTISSKDLSITEMKQCEWVAMEIFKD